MPLTINVNGVPRRIDADENMPLLWALRDDLGLVGTKFGCGIAQCGACTVLVDGTPSRSCVTPLRVVGEAKITTIEGVDGPEAEAVRSAWVGIDVPQCGYCQSGQVLAATALLRSNPVPSAADIDKAMRGNACRCATYVRIRQAIHDAAEVLET